MRLDGIEKLYPNAAAIIREVMSDSGVTYQAIEGLSINALDRIEAGTTSRRDTRVLLVARQAQVERARR